MENQSLPPQSSLQQPSYSPHDERVVPNLWRIIAIVLFIMLIAIGGVYLFNSQSQKPMVISLQQTPQQQVIVPTITLSQRAFPQKNIEDFSFSENDLFYKTEKILTIQVSDPECDKYKFEILDTKEFVSISPNGRYLIVNGECSGKFLSGKEPEFSDARIYSVLIDTTKKIKITEMLFDWGSDQLHFSTFLNDDYILASEGEMKGGKRDFVLKAFDISNERYIELKRIEDVRVITWPMDLDLSSKDYATFTVWVGQGISHSISWFDKIKLRKNGGYELRFQLNRSNLSLEII